jgi:hypothetical protein
MKSQKVANSVAQSGKESVGMDEPEKLGRPLR